MTPDDLPPAVLLVTALHGRWVQVRLPDGTEEDWPLASLPQGVTVGDQVTVLVVAGDLEVSVTRPSCLRA